MHNSFEFKVGFQQFANRCPESLKPGRESFVWYIEECKRMGAHSLSMMPVARIPESENTTRDTWSSRIWATCGRWPPLQRRRTCTL